ncbi:sugar ABC transporter permease [Treponema zuelzerae]|uniref:Xylose transport system permease protein XylH n=1 Tax=Teretinema zuelzerae TaxID=156 RepID=A0AAE3EGB6_9SPIR|nr:sugar ABC transporter permease [Teretinema zuelzerae]MCD1653986.1 sugar ABC transporter permease [Teretinema zuelzerae]
MSDSIAAANKMSFRNLIKSNAKNYSMVLMLALIMIIFAFMTDGVNLNSRNITNIFMQNSHILLLATTMILLIITCNIDLSCPATCAFIGAVSAMLYNTGMGMIPTVLLSILLSIAIYAVMGFMVAYMRMPAFIVTLGFMLLFRGLVYIITNVTPIALKDDGYKKISSGIFNIPALTVDRVHYTAMLVAAVLFVLYVVSEIAARRKKIRYGFAIPPVAVFIAKIIVIGALIFALGWKFATYRGIPVVVVVLGCTVGIIHFVSRNTVLGRYIYAVGGNARSAKLSGINSEFVIFIVFCMMGSVAGLASIVFTGYMNSALPQAGTMFDMDSIAACYIGGASATGGIGSVTGAIIGGLVMAGINNGMSLMNIAAQWQYVVKAIILLLAVFYDIYSRRKAGLG